MPASATPQAIVAGHIALDIIPIFKKFKGDLGTLLAPGKLIEVGGPVIAAGGAVHNTGLALHRLGIATGLMGKVGDDLLGRAILELIRAEDRRLAEGMIVVAEENTSYSVVLSPPGVDRIFLHNPGANDTFDAKDIDYRKLEGVRLFHFGYPPLMRRMYSDDGENLELLVSRAKQAGAMVSLDMAMPDPASPAGKVNWVTILKRTLPHVDIFLPSTDEIFYMLGTGGDRLPAGTDGPLLDQVARRLLDYGARIVVLKLGAPGLYLRTASDRRRLMELQPNLGGDTGAWVGRELWSGSFEVEVVGATGAGDCAIAGFLAGILKGQRPEEALTSAAAVGAFSVERADAISGVPSWKEVQARIHSVWRRQDPAINLPQWRPAKDGVWIGPHDGR